MIRISIELVFNHIRWNAFYIYVELGKTIDVSFYKFYKFEHELGIEPPTQEYLCFFLAGEEGDFLEYFHSAFSDVGDPWSF